MLEMSIFDLYPPIKLKVRVLIGCVLWVIISMASLLLAQNSIQVEKLTTQEGLNFRHVDAVIQDREGFMWFGTTQGIAKYDGNQFIIFDSSKGNPHFIPFEQISKFIYQETSNTLWFIANHKLFALNLDTEKLNIIKDPEKILAGEVLEIALDKTDNLWVVTDEFDSYKIKRQFLIKFDGNSFRLIKSLERKSTGFTSIDITATNLICWSTVNHGIMLLNQNGEILQNKILETYDWYGYKIHFAESFFDSKNSHYYFSESKGGVDVYKDLEFSHTLLKHKEVFYHAEEDAYGGIWFAGKRELFYLDANRKIIDYSYDVSKKMNFSSINTIFLDDSNLLWLGTDNGLLKVKLKPQNFERILENKDKKWGKTFRSIFPLKDGYVAVMCESENQLYKINTAGNASPIVLQNSYQKLKDARFFVSDTVKNKAFTVNNSLIEIDFNSQSLNTYDEFSFYLNETKPNPILRLKDGSLLTGFKLSKLIQIDADTKAFSLIFDSQPLKDYELITYIQSEINPEIIWIATQSQGLLKVNLNGTIEEEFTVNTNPSLSKNSVLSLLEYKNNLLIGTFGGGVNVLDLEKHTIEVIDKKKGLSDNNVVSILPADANKIVVATYNGLSTFNLKTKMHYNYFVEDGLTHNEFNYTSAYKDINGNFYLGGLNGINKFKFEELFQEYTLPALNFTGFEVYNQRNKSTRRISKLKEEAIVLSPYDQHFMIDWSIPVYFGKSQYSFYTKLEGFDQDWFYQGSANSIRYNKLPAGTYNFKVKGMDANGNESRAGLSIPIYVEQIFYKRWWFISLLVLFVFGVIYLFFQYRLNQALAMERLRTKISSDLHDDVGSMLTGLAMQTEMLEMQTNHKIDKNRLHKITTMSRDTISHMRDLVWSIDSRRDTFSDLLERMQELAEEMLLPAQIAYSIDADVMNPNRKINFNCKRNLFLIFKEAITNILKHSNADKVNVKISNKDEQCILHIKDNGRVETFESGSGMGLANMKLRCENMNGQLTLDFENGFGVKVYLPHSI